MGPTWGPSGTDRTQIGPVLVPWTLLSGTFGFLTFRHRVTHTYFIELHHNSFSVGYIFFRHNQLSAWMWETKYHGSQRCNNFFHNFSLAHMYNQTYPKSATSTMHAKVNNAPSTKKGELPHAGNKLSNEFDDRLAEVALAKAGVEAISWCKHGPELKRK